MALDHVQTAFMQSIIKPPQGQDDAPRLIYADWLEEHNNPRGEFIRIQYKLEDLNRPQKERKELLRREQQLLKAHRNQWIAEDLSCLPDNIMQGLNPKYLTFSKGFLDIIAMSPQQLATMRGLHAPRLRSRAGQNDINEIFYDLTDERSLSRGRTNSIGLTPAEIKTLILRGFNVKKAPQDFIEDYPPPLYAVLSYFNKTNRLAVLQILIDAGANVSLNSLPYDNFEGCNSPLMYIAWDKRELIDEARLLVRNGANIFKRQDGETVLQYIKDEDSPLYQAIQEESRLYQQNQGFKESIRKENGRARGRAGGKS